MAQVNPRRKLYARLDANGRVVPGQIVARLKKPRIGRWIEITSQVCCTTTTEEL